MPQVSYRGIPEHGLTLITPADQAYETFVNDILNRPQPFPAWPAADPSVASVLWNQSGKAIIGLSYLWRFHKPGAPPTRHRGSNLASSMQFDVLAGRAPLVPDLCTFVLPGSKRWITRQGMFGNNLDVRPDLPRIGGFAGSGGGSRNRAIDALVDNIEFSLDFAILEDGLCVGPDEDDIFGQLRKGLADQAALAATIVNRLRSGATPGQIFDLIRPLARRDNPPPASEHNFLMLFVGSAIHRLTHQSDAEIQAWFEQEAELSLDRLRRP